MGLKTTLQPSTFKLLASLVLLLTLVPFVEVSQPLMCDFNWWDCDSTHLDSPLLFALNMGTYYVYSGISTPVLALGALGSYFFACALSARFEKTNQKAGWKPLNRVL